MTATESSSAVDQEAATVSSSSGDTTDQKPSPAQMAVDLASEQAQFGQDPNRRCWAVIDTDGKRDALPLDSSEFQDWLNYAFYRHHGRILSQNALKEACSVLRGTTMAEGQRIEISLRVKQDAGELLTIDLQDERSQVVQLTPGSWSVVGADQSRHLFYRAQGMAPLPIPNPKGDIERLRPYLNLEDQKQFWLLVIAVAFILTGRGPFPILLFIGEAGSGKSEAARMVRALVDPSRVPLQTAPRTDRDAMIACSNMLMLLIDNARPFSAKESDLLARLSTGGGLRTRRLRSDAQEQLFDVMAPVLVTGIEDLSTQPDLADRAVVIPFKRIGDADRRTQEELSRQFKEDAPYILGGLLDLIAGAWAFMPTLKPDRLPRMADFGRFGLAAEQHLGLAEGAFMALYGNSQRQATSGMSETDPLLSALLDFTEHLNGEWVGTAQQLLDLLVSRVQPAVTRQRKLWPANARSFGIKLRSLRPVLAIHGVEFENFSSGGRRLRLTVNRPNDAEAGTAEADSEQLVQRGTGDGNILDFRLSDASKVS
ncbi:hypothetical protein [Motiliproteus sp. SC1-56]|uniref:hypothetical protein n=1 Tax=Motiliproteus sp. SC1-56 TaxID=2799565 RepID=UPI001A8DE3F9|nr:hypothetical protein [Motiliproteus sp. SC1-56]